MNFYLRERERACRMLEEEGSTKKVIVRLRKEQPELTLATVAHMIGLSTERVRQILIAEGMPTKAIRPPKKERRRTMNQQERNERRELYPPEGHTFIWWWPTTNVVCTRCGAKRTKSNGE